MDSRPRFRAYVIVRRLALTALATLAMAVCWIVPARLLNAGKSSWHACAYIGDEYIYAQRVQPIAGTTNTNPTNGVCDPNAISPYFLEDACRTFLKLTGLTAIDLVWIWRLVIPAALMAAMLALARVCLPRTRAPWSIELRLAAAAAAFGLLYFIYDLVTPYPPCHGYLDRFPSNIEYPLAVAFAALCVWFVDRPDAIRAVSLAVAGALLVYLRPYAALPWGIAAGLLVLNALRVRALSARSLLLMSAVFVILMAPWIAINQINARSGAFNDVMVRYFDLPGPGLKRPYQVHPQWALYLGFAAALLVLARFCRQRAFALCGALTLAALPFISGLFTISAQLVGYDRYGVFYLVALITTLLLVLRGVSLGWRGRAGMAACLRGTVALSALALVGAGVLAWKNCALDFATYPGGTYASIAADQAYIPAYQWVRRNTPADALFIVDDGFDWSLAPTDVDGWRQLMTNFAFREDLFQLVARRRVVYTDRLFFNLLSTADLDSLGVLQHGTLGMRLNKQEYLAALKRFRPRYIFWRKTPTFGITDRVAPIPRGYGSYLTPMREIVFSDDVCEIWKLNY